MFIITDTPMNLVGQMLYLNVPNLSQTITDLFSNLTLSLMVIRDDVAEVEVSNWDGRVVWSYDKTTLWSAYGPALFCAILIAAYAIHCVYTNGSGMDVTFSEFLLVTRNHQLDHMCQAVENNGQLKQKVLCFRDGVIEVVE
jgi:hypothetical protein